MTLPAGTKPSPKPRRDRAKLSRRILIAGGAFAVAVAAVMSIATRFTTNDLENTSSQLKTERQTTDELVAKAIVLCTGATSDELAKLRAVGLCQAAQSAAASKTTDTTGTTGIYSVVADFVPSYLAAHPPRDGHTPTPEEIEPAVRGAVDAHLAANPPAAGRDASPPTDDQLLALIRLVYAQNPPKNGVDGKNAHCYDVPDDPACQPKQGPQGVSVQSIRFEGDPSSCVVVATLFDPATGTTSEQRAPISGGACEPPDSGSPMATTEPPASSAGDSPILPIPTT